MVQLYKRLKITAGGFHSWWESSVGIIRKPNNSINYLDVRTKEERVEDSKIQSSTTVEPKVAETITEKTTMPTNYSFGITLKKGIISYALFFLGVLISQAIGDYPQVFDLTLGGILMMAYNFLKHKVAIRLP